MSSLLVRIIPFAFVAMWSTGFIAAKYAAPVASPFSLLALRMGVVIVLMGAFALARRRPWPNLSTALHAMLVGVMLHAAYLGGVFWAVKHGLPSGFSALIVGLQPMLTAVVAWALLKEKITLRHGLGLGLGFIGVALVLAPRFGTSVEGVTPITVGVGFLAVLAMAYGTVHQKKYVTGADMITSTLLQYIGAAIVLVPLGWAEGFALVPSWQLLAVVAWLALVLSIGAVLLLLYMVQQGQVAKVAALFYLVPPTGAVMAFVLFGESLSPIQIFGTGLVVLAVALATYSGSK